MKKSSLKEGRWEAASYQEAVSYIEEIPKFTKKHPLNHTREFFKKAGEPGRRPENHTCGRHQWKGFGLHLYQDDTDGRGEEDRVLYIPSSCIRQRTDPDQRGAGGRRHLLPGLPGGL